jgi:cell wall-associated NlpC family hydrolase
MYVNDLIGVPYKEHGRGKDGMDCYGLCVEVMRRGGFTLPDIWYGDTERETNKKMAETLAASIPNVKIEKPEIGCVIEFNILGDPSHVGVYLGEGCFIHASKTHGVCIDKLYRWRARVNGFYRITS